MKKNFTLLFLLVTLSLAGVAQTKYFKGIFQSSQENPPNASAAFGVVIVRYNVETNEFQLAADFQNLSGPITAAHIHNAVAGVNGGVVFGLTSFGLTSGTLTANVVLTEGQETELLAGRYYANAHTALNSGGEIRAQLSEATPGQSRYLAASLSGSQEVPPNGSGAMGGMVVLLDKGQSKIYATGTFSGLSANATAAHLHTAPPGTNGGVTFPLSATTGFTAGVLSTTATVNAQQIADFETGLLYANVHNASFPGGEIRGQLAIVPDPQAVYFKGLFSASQEVPTNASPASGVVLVKYDLGTNVFILTADYQNLVDPITASHIHNAAAGVNGGVVFSLTNSGLTSGSLVVSTVITDLQEIELLAGRFYANVHTTTNPGGEARAQLTPTTEGMTLNLNGIFSGTQEVPPNASAGTGFVNSLLDKTTGMLYVTGAFSGLGSPSTGAHLHKAAIGVNGGVIFPLNFTPGFPAGVVSISTAVDAQTSADLQNGLFYANVHSTGFPGGEVRTQLGNSTALPVKLISFNGYKNRQNVLLSWEVSNQQNFRNFSVEQLNTQTNKWINKGDVSVVGTADKQQYTLNDLPILLSDVLYYRLKMIDLDGKTAYSAIVKINFKTGKAQLSLLNNPVRGNLLQFQLSGILSASGANASVSDVSGRLLIKSNTINVGTNTLDISSLAKGMYKLMIRVDNELIETSFLK